jgi:small subunit ribosomal protein S4e
LDADVISIAKTNENFRLLYDSKGRFTLHHINSDEAKVLAALLTSPLCRKVLIAYLSIGWARLLSYLEMIYKYILRYVQAPKIIWETHKEIFK